ncbi:hypothetical protein PFAG_05313 [Plasmodium falciparum Santa Lucia]|uniref:Uncharacterized protein n=1 Tax=Plasmodium falciparum Santa Lucia TaxID=478859 RepID=W7FPF7_PLAFA|nr:hypothetical protein PFAG_05313 [Plasmodium falciparum Santa Lucia]
MARKTRFVPFIFLFKHIHTYVMHPFYDNLEILEGGTHTIALPSIRDQINDGSLFLQ